MKNLDSKAKFALAIILAPIYIPAFLIMHFTWDWYEKLWKS